jgi:hypothetical protein
MEDARMTYSDVQTALHKGTVIFNAAGAHIPRLAGPSLALTDATSLPCAINVYITHPDMRTSAPPHTDKQDVWVVQSTGRKQWRVYGPPDPARRPHVDPFARGKLTDPMPVHLLEHEWQCPLLLDVTLVPGDVLFVPAGFPHTTSTTHDRMDTTGSVWTVEQQEEAAASTSVHLTLGIDHHIWGLDYLTVRRWALQRAGVVDTTLGNTAYEERYQGKVNEVLPRSVVFDLMTPLPMGLLDDDNEQDKESMIQSVVDRLQSLSRTVDAALADRVDDSVWRATVERVIQHGRTLLDIHRDMYLAAIDEGRLREQEDAMTSHLQHVSKRRRPLSAERIQRMSVFRVKQYYDQINAAIASMREWAESGMSSNNSNDNTKADPRWAWTAPLHVGDAVEADLGGALFPATVTRASGGTFDVQFFDGDSETNLQREQIKLVQSNQKAATNAVDTSSMTPKQLKRWKKQQEKLAQQ